MKKALVLGGGGAKGSYQIGVWKALKKLHIKFDIVTGVSIGSINGAMYASNKFHIAEKIWRKTKTSDLFDYEMADELSKNEFLKLFKEMITKGGMSFSKAEQYLKKYINEKDVKESNIDYGLLTFSIKNNKPKALTKKNIPDGKLIDYISASSICYPFVEKKEIDGDYFIDGGYYDGVPINLAIDMGATEILAIDLSVLSLNKDIKDPSVKVDVIKMQDKTPFTLSFTKAYAIKNINLGYNDTMKHFNKLDGKYYTFKKNNLTNNYIALKDKFIFTIKNILSNKKIVKLLNIGKIGKILNKIQNSKKINKELNETVEYLGKIFDFPNERIYQINKFNRLLLREARKLSYIKINTNLKDKYLVAYIYNKYLKEKNVNKLRKELSNIALVFPKDFLGAMYLITINNKIKK